MQFRNDIQGLRALAFLFVFIFHLKSSWLPGGYIGVDMFFVISGFLIGSIILHQKEAQKFSFLSFYEKRLKRIVPAYFYVLLVIAIAGYFFYIPSDSGMLRGTLFRSAAFISNMLFASGESYFGAQSHENPLLHTWSLAIEMQFYLFLPLVLIFINKKYLSYILAGTLILLTAYTTWQIYASHAKTAMYFSLLARIPEFFFGVLFSLLSRSKLKINKNVNLALNILGLFGLIMCSFLLTSESNFPGALAVIPSVATGFLLIPSDNIISRFFATKPLVRIGEWSYSLYLWHWPIMAFMRYKQYDFGIPETCFIITLTFLLSYISYTFIENTYRKFNLGKFVLTFSPVVVIFIIVAYLFPIYADRHKIDDYYTTRFFGVKSHGHPEVETFGSSSPKIAVKILLIGNSHALMTKPFLNYIGEKEGFSFRTVTSSAYPAIKGIDRGEVPLNDYRSYNASLSLIPLTSQEIKKCDIVIFNMHNFCSVHSIKNALLQLINELHANQKLILLNTFPIVDSNPLRVNYSIKKETDKKFKIIDNTCSNLLIKAISDKYENVYYYDLSKSEVFDNPPFYHDTLSYYDSGHINTYGSVEMAKDLRKDFTNFLLEVIDYKVQK